MKKETKKQLLIEAALVLELLFLLLYLNGRIDRSEERRRERV